ncbi:MAG: dihydroorotase, partial [Verrucomicrobiota bacterium]
DCKGKIILPSLFDINVHAHDPGQDAISNSAAAAIDGGVTAIVLMPNTTLAIDSGFLVETVLERGRNTPIEVIAAGAVTKGRGGEELASIAGMQKAGAPFLTDDDRPATNPQLLRRAMEYARDFGLFFVSHCEVEELSNGGVMNEGKVSYELGLAGIAAISEEVCIERDLRIAQYTGSHVHVQHVSTQRGLSIIRRFKERGGKEGFRVTCEVSPHHLILNESDIVDYDPNLKMNPPLRTKADNQALLDGLNDGVIDVIATDHSPHSEFEKNTDFASAPFGVTGLETALPSLYDRFIQNDHLSWSAIVKHYSAEPRRLLGKEAVSIAKGQPAEFLVFDPSRKTRFTKDFMRGRAANTPFLDQELDGQVTEVVYGGNILISR